MTFLFLRQKFTCLHGQGQGDNFGDKTQASKQGNTQTHTQVNK